jgi:hypothetical protein
VAETHLGRRSETVAALGQARADAEDATPSPELACGALADGVEDICARGDAQVGLNLFMTLNVCVGAYVPAFSSPSTVFLQSQ